MTDDECQHLLEDLCTLEDGACRFQEVIIEDGVEQTVRACSATPADLVEGEEEWWDMDHDYDDLTPEEERDIERGIYFMASFYDCLWLAEVAAYLLHKYWGLLT